MTLERDTIHSFQSIPDGTDVTPEELDQMPDRIEIAELESAADQLALKTKLIYFFESNPEEYTQFLTDRVRSDDCTANELQAIAVLVKNVYSAAHFSLTIKGILNSCELAEALIESGQNDASKTIGLSLNNLIHGYDFHSNGPVLFLEIAAVLEACGYELFCIDLIEACVQDPHWNETVFNNVLKVLIAHQRDTVIAELIKKTHFLSSYTIKTKHILKELTAAGCARATSEIEAQLYSKASSTQQLFSQKEIKEQVFEYWLMAGNYEQVVRLMNRYQFSITNLEHLVPLLSYLTSVPAPAVTLTDYSMLYHLYSRLFNLLTRGKISSSTVRAQAVGLGVSQWGFDKLEMFTTRMPEEDLVEVAKIALLRDPYLTELTTLLSRLTSPVLLAELFSCFLPYMQSTELTHIFQEHIKKNHHFSIDFWLTLGKKITSSDKQGQLLFNLRTVLERLSTDDKLHCVASLLEVSNPNEEVLKQLRGTLTQVFTPLFATVAITAEHLRHIATISQLFDGIQHRMYIQNIEASICDFLKSDAGSQFLNEYRYSLARVELAAMAKRLVFRDLTAALQDSTSLSSVLIDIQTDSFVDSKLIRLFNAAQKLNQTAGLIETIAQEIPCIKFLKLCKVLEPHLSRIQMEQVLKTYLSHNTSDIVVFTVLKYCIQARLFGVVESHLSVVFKHGHELLHSLFLPLKDSALFAQATYDHIATLDFGAIAKGGYQQLFSMISAVYQLSQPKGVQLLQYIHRFAIRYGNHELISMLYCCSYELGAANVLPTIIINDEDEQNQLLNKLVQYSNSLVKLQRLGASLTPSQWLDHSLELVKHRTKRHLEQYCSQSRDNQTLSEAKSAATLDNITTNSVDLRPYNIKSIAHQIRQIEPDLFEAFNVLQQVVAQRNAANGFRETDQSSWINREKYSWDEFVRESLLERYQESLPSVLSSVISQPDLPIGSLYTNWCKCSPTPYLTTLKNLTTIATLQKEAKPESPNPAQTLFSRFGIRNFGRYPERVLEQQLDLEEGTHVIVYVATLLDHNGSNYRRKEHILDMSEQAGRHGHQLVVIEAADPVAVAFRLGILKNKLKVKIAGVIVSAHGNSTGFDLSEKESGQVNVQNIRPPLVSWLDHINQVSNQSGQVTQTDTARSQTRAWDEYARKVVAASQIGVTSNFQYQERIKRAPVQEAIISKILSCLEPNCAFGTFMCKAGVTDGLVAQMSKLINTIASGSIESTSPRAIKLVFGTDNRLISILTMYHKGETSVYRNGVLLPWGPQLHAVFTGRLSIDELLKMI